MTVRWVPLVMFGPLAIAFVVLYVRQIKIIERERIRRSEPFVRLAEAFLNVQIAIRDQLTPILREAAASMVAFGEAYQRSRRTDG